MKVATNSDVTVAFTLPVTHRCPFKDEVDRGEVTMSWRTTHGTLELHDLAAMLGEKRDEEISHEDFTAWVVDELTSMGFEDVLAESTWHIAGGRVVVRCAGGSGQPCSEGDSEHARRTDSERDAVVRAAKSTIDQLRVTVSDLTDQLFNATEHNDDLERQADVGRWLLAEANWRLFEAHAELGRHEILTERLRAELNAVKAAVVDSGITLPDPLNGWPTAAGETPEQLTEGFEHGPTPRTWRAGDPEPPADVTALYESVDPAFGQFRYLVRCSESGWARAHCPNPVHRPRIGGSWDIYAGKARGELTEVLPEAKDV